MRVRLDNGKDYDLLAMFTPSWVGHKKAMEALRKNYSVWINALTLPLNTKVTFLGLLKWLLVLTLHSISLLLLPFIFIFGCSMKAYTIFLSDDVKRMQQYKADLQKIYHDLQDIEDQDEYKKRLKEEIAKVKPF
jgi:hypothetical protein